MSFTCTLAIDGTAKAFKTWNGLLTYFTYPFEDKNYYHHLLKINCQQLKKDYWTVGGDSGITLRNRHRVRQHTKLYQCLKLYNYFRTGTQSCIYILIFFFPNIIAFALYSHLGGTVTIKKKRKKWEFIQRNYATGIANCTVILDFPQGLKGRM